MKIVDVSGFYSETGGGVASYVRQKLSAAARRGHEVVVIAPGAKSHVETRLGGKIIWVSAPPMPFDSNYRVFLGAREAWRAIEAEAPDVIEGSSPWRGGWIAAGAPGNALKSLVFHQDFIAGYPYTALDRVLSRPRIDRLFGGYWAYVRRLSAHFDMTVTGGEWLAERLQAFGVHRPLAVPFGIETDLFSPDRRDESLRREVLAACHAPPGAKLLIAVGRLHPEKRHSTIIEGFARARARHPEIVLAVIGDGPAKASVARRAARVEGVSLLGPVKDRLKLAALYASADVLVHGSGAETYGLVVAEAISSGLPVVTPDTGGAADLARQGRSATYATGDASDCARAIEAILTLRPAASEGGARPTGPSSAESHFAQLFELYERRLSGKRADFTPRAA